MSATNAKESTAAFWRRTAKQAEQERDKALAERDEMYKLSTKMLARVNIVVSAYAAGADLNTLYDVIQTELAPLVEHEEDV